MYSDLSNEILDAIQYQMSDEERKEMYEHYIKEECNDIDKFWDWIESLENEDIENLLIDYPNLLD